jgi:hypothetical protein
LRQRRIHSGLALLHVLRRKVQFLIESIVVRLAPATGLAARARSA